jgi:catechol 2,3-dioxygenase-like lactoylglutathione lyase family enzyme
MIQGAHVVLYSKDAEADRAFFRDVLDFQVVDAGHGWLIFALPAAEAAIHPIEGEEQHQSLNASLYLMCDDLDALIASLKAKNVECAKIETQRWGITTAISLPSGGTLGLYQPAHPTALHLNSK